MRLYLRAGIGMGLAGKLDAVGLQKSCIRIDE